MQHAECLESAVYVECAIYCAQCVVSTVKLQSAVYIECAVYCVQCVVSAVKCAVFY